MSGQVSSPSLIKQFVPVKSWVRKSKLSCLGAGLRGSFWHPTMHRQQEHFCRRYAPEESEFPVG